MSTCFFLPLADLEGVIRALFPIIAFIVWILFQAIAKGKQAAQGGGLKQANAPKRGRIQVLRDELEAFIQQAAENQNRAARVEADPIEAEVVEEPAVRRSSIANSPRIISQLDEHTDHVAENVIHVEDEVEARLHAKFDRKVSNFASIGSPVEEMKRDKTEGIEEESELSMAQELRETFKQPQSVRRAMIMNEILRRPEERWER